MKGFFGFLGLGAVFNTASGWVGIFLLVILAGSGIGHLVGPRPVLAAAIAYSGIAISWVVAIILDIAIIKGTIFGEDGCGGVFLALFLLPLATLFPSAILAIVFSFMGMGTCAHGNDIFGWAMPKLLMFFVGGALYPESVVEMTEGFC